jgi:hypothetical protein
MTFKTQIELSVTDGEVDAEIEFDYEAGERQTFDHPGYPADVEVTSVTIDGKDLDLISLSKDDMIKLELACWEKLGDLEDDDIE